MSFKASEFVSSELSLADVNSLLKDDLISLAKFLELEFVSKSRKAVIKELIVAELVDLDKLPASAEEELRSSGLV